MADTLSLFPVGTTVDLQGHLVIGGCDTVELAQTYGTPLYIFDEATLREQCRSFNVVFHSYYPDSQVLYACKAFICKALARLLAEEGQGLDVVSAGEAAIARAAGFPLERVYFHGNNKAPEELEMALEWGVGRIVLDNEHELALLKAVAQRQGRRARVLLRVSPGVDPHTHQYTTTGLVDSKFGLPLVTGQAEAALVRALASPTLEVVGLHFHLGSPIAEVAPYIEALERVLPFAAEMRRKHRFSLRELSPGGGFPVAYTEEAALPSLAQYAEGISSTLKEACSRLGLDLPRLVVEPGRALVGRAGVALYRVGAIKDIPGIRKYIALDGGMGDNIRPALYGSRYRAVIANRRASGGAEVVTLCGRYCESGDVLIRDISLPPTESGDLVAMPAAGAYQLAMASNYNASLRPAIVMVQGGQARLVRRRETFEDLMRCDLD
ncbi:MAG: diaminopimelate decarboxylase [Chloroflexi bacterium]|nr:diaminopimelate decarboxylase [Chloroflexota bacterium]